MININKTSENSKIYIQRNITNDEPVINNYVTEDELQEILKEYNSIPYIVIDDFSHSSFKITKGDWDAVHNAIQNKNPYLIYARSSNSGKIFSLVDDIAPLPNGDVSIATTLIVANGNVTYRTWNIDINGNVELSLEERYTIQPKLVSGENIKTINGNDILGEGDIIIESGNGNIVELTQSEYDNLTPEPDTLYVISDAPAIEIPNASIPYLIVSNTAILGGNFNDVYNAIENGNPYILYINVFDGSGDNKFSPAEEVFTKNGMIECSYSFTYFSSFGNYINVKYRVVNIYPDRVSVYSNSETTVPKTFKTINNQSIVGSGNINIESGGNIVELTQSEYNSITPEPDTLYLISDSNINTNLKTINGESIIGEGDINIDVDLTGYATTVYVDEQIGDINSVLENIIG